MTTPEIFPPEAFERQSLLKAIISKIEDDESIAIWAPRYTGRTILLHSLEAHYKKADGCLAVYTLPHLHLDPAGRHQLFSTLAVHVEHTYKRVYGEMAETRLTPVRDSPNALRDFVSGFLIATGLRRLILLIDDCDQLLSTALVDLIREFRAVQNHRRYKEFEHLQRFSVVVAGAVSFRNLKLLEKEELSPFDDWPWFTIEDLNLNEASAYLASAFGKLDLEIGDDAMQAILQYGGGDLNRLNHICSAVVRVTRGPTVKNETVAEVVEKLLETYRTDPSSSYMISVISHDPRCLGVLENVIEGQPKFLRTHLDHWQKKYFRISNPELSGGFLLDRDEQREPIAWRFRNRYAEEVLNRHFDTATMMRAYIDLGRSNDAMNYAEELERNLAKCFRDDLYDFDEAALRDIVEARLEYLDLPGSNRRSERGSSHKRAISSQRKPRFGDRLQHAFLLVSHILSDIFGFEDAVLYEKRGVEDVLTPINTLPTPPFNTAHVEPIALEDHRRREVRVFVSGLYTVEIEGGDHLKIVIPLKDFQGRYTGVLSIRSKKYMEGWSTLFVRIPIVERSLNFVWRRLSRIEAEQVALLEQAASLDSAESGNNVSRIPIFGVTEFDTELHRHLERNLKRFSVLEATFLKARDDYVYDRVLMAMRDALILVDITKINSNVFFELGLAIGLNRPGFLMAEESLYRVRPRMIDGRGYLPYRLKSPLGVDFLSQVRKSWLSYQRDIQDDSYVHMLQRKLESVKSPADRYIVAIGHDELQDDSKFRRAIEVASGKLSLAERSIWQTDDRPHHTLSIHSGTILQTVYSQLSHAKAVIARVEDLETAARASHFVAIGIAKGLEERLGTPRVLICGRERSPAGATVDIPSDLRGLPLISFEPNRWQQFSKQLGDLLRDMS